MAHDGPDKPASARASEGKTPVREAHGRPPDFPNLQMQGSTVWEPNSIGPKAHVRVHQARTPIPDVGAREPPDLWPSPGIITVNPAVCLGSASQLDGEQNIHMPSVGSELHAAPTAPQFSSFSSSLFPSDTLAHKNPPREGAASEWHAANTCPERWEPPDLPCGEGAAIERQHRSPSPRALENHPIRMMKSCRNQGERRQHRTTYLLSKIISGLVQWPRTRM